MIETTKINKRVVFCLVVLLLVQILLMFYFASQKAGFFVDETCTYQSANYGDAPEGTNGLMWYNTMEQWLPGSFFTEALTANGDKCFDFSIAYHNQENDAHAPFYDMLIHFTSSLFPGILSKWIGVAPNLLFNFITTIILFFMASNLYKDNKIALITAAFWSLSVGCMASTIFIRMYALMTLECVLFVWFHFRFFDRLVDKVGLREYVPLFICTILGTLTQYYFLIFAFFLCGFFTLYLLSKNKMLALKYALCEFMAVFSAGLLFPRMWFQLVGGERGGEAVANLAGSELFIEHLKTVCGIISANLFGKKLILIILAFIVFTLIIMFLHKNIMHWSVKKEQSGLVLQSNIYLNKEIELLLKPKSILYWMIVFTVLMYLLLVVKLAPYQTDRYYMCLYPFIILLVVGFLFKALHYIVNNKKRTYKIVVALCLMLCVVSYLIQPVDYVYAESAKRVEAVSSYYDYPVILINGLGFDAATDVFVFEYQHNKAVYRCRWGDYSGLTNAASTYDLSGGFVLYAYWQRENGLFDEDIFARINEYLPIAEYELISDVGCPVFFCIPANNI